MHITWRGDLTRPVKKCGLQKLVGNRYRGLSLPDLLASTFLEVACTNCWLLKAERFLVVHCRVLAGTKLDVRESVHRDIIMNVTNKMQLYRLLNFSLSALHVSGDVFAHHHEHLTVFTVSGCVHPSCCRLVSWLS